MNRRDALRLLASAAALPLLHGRGMKMLQQARAVVGTPGSLRTLNPQQAKLVKTIVDMILPRTDTPGAVDAGALDFIDLMLTEWYDVDAGKRFSDGLAKVEEESQSLFGKSFIGCSPIQQSQMLIALGEKMTAESGPVHHVRQHGDWAARSQEAFYPMLRRLTLTAYYTSEPGATEELKFEIIPEQHVPCAAETGKEVPEKQ